MSVGFPTNEDTVAPKVNGTHELPVRDLVEVIAAVQEAIAPVWPLKDYVAVNPYGGFSSDSFLEARSKLQTVSDCETLMPVSYYQERFKQGKFGLSELELAIDEMVEDQIPGAESLCANAMFQLLSSDGELPAAASIESKPTLSSTSCSYDQANATHWTEAIHEEISKFCASHYDEGQARWSSPWKQLPLYQAWRIRAQQDRKIEILGLTGFRRFVGELSNSPELAIASLLHKADVSPSNWQHYLLSLAMSLPGWSAWAKYKTDEATKKGEQHSDFIGLLAIRLAYDVAFQKHFDLQVDAAFSNDHADTWSEETLLRLTLLRANEIAFRGKLLQGVHEQLLANSDCDLDSKTNTKPALAQMVFCIDVRSERIRRNLEAVSSDIETYGFAGFFGLPFEYVRLGEEMGTNQLPVLVEPQFKVYEDLCIEEQPEIAQSKLRRIRLRGLRNVWKRFQTSAVSSFAFVESAGLLFGGKLLSKTLAVPQTPSSRDGILPQNQDRLRPSFAGLHEQEITSAAQVDMAEAILTGIGLRENFARLVVLCGHTSQTENNPLQASLDCGACGGHSGEPNARFAARLLNQPNVKAALVERGIEIPEDTCFVAGLHNTTTDQIEFFDLEGISYSQHHCVASLSEYVSQASSMTRSERLELLPSSNQEALQKRGVDWSEIRPEWGLSGNAAFVVGPRSLTKAMNLKGESFLHSYNYRQDPEGKTLEQIMTAPMVVANWINMQYYASTVDQQHFGSGDKTVHNVVGKFGLFSGNGGDLQTGLPWQSLHDGEAYRHDPVRLLTVIEAPRAFVNRILASHENVRDLVVNGWVNLVVVEDGNFYRYSARESWELLEIGMPQSEVKESATDTSTVLST